MAKLKGVKKLNKAVSAEFLPFGISKVTLGTDYAYYYEKARITFKLNETIEDDWFREFVAERFKYTCDYPFIIEFLHEVGHHLANDEIDGAIAEFCNLEKARIQHELDVINLHDIATRKKLEWEYFNLPEEIMATQWAVNYAKTHPKKVRKMAKRIINSMVDFYIKNGVTEDN